MPSSTANTQRRGVGEAAFSKNDGGHGYGVAGGEPMLYHRRYMERLLRGLAAGRSSAPLVGEAFRG
jgi:hypothetical protein